MCESVWERVRESVCVCVCVKQPPCLFLCSRSWRRDCHCCCLPCLYSCLGSSYQQEQTPPSENFLTWEKNNRLLERKREKEKERKKERGKERERERREREKQQRRDISLLGIPSWGCHREEVGWRLASLAADSGFDGLGCEFFCLCHLKDLLYPFDDLRHCRPCIVVMCPTV